MHVAAGGNLSSSTAFMFFMEAIMPLGLAFWILMLIWLVFGVWYNWPNHVAVGGNLLIFILFALLGWHAFGAPIH